MKRDAIGEPRSPAAAPITLQLDEVHIWRVEVAGEDRRGAARRSLAEILGGYLGGPEASGVVVAEGGKPRLATAPERLAFNLTHSGDLALVAIAPGGVEVGIDVELLRPRRDLTRLAARWLPEADAAAVAGAADGEREQIFYAAWTRHEARVKCTGAGLDGGPPPGEDVVAHHLDIDPGYAAAFALSGQGEATPPISVRRFDLDV